MTMTKTDIKDSTTKPTLSTPSNVQQQEGQRCYATSVSYTMNGTVERSAPGNKTLREPSVTTSALDIVHGLKWNKDVGVPEIVVRVQLVRHCNCLDGLDVWISIDDF